VGQKKLDHFRTLITLQRLAVERRVICEKFANLSRKKGQESDMLNQAIDQLPKTDDDYQGCPC